MIRTKTNFGDRRYSVAATTVEVSATISTVVEDTGATKNGLKTWRFSKAFGE
jgi:hypothetical protein